MKWQISTKGGHGTDSHPSKSCNDSWGQFGRPSIGFSCGSGWHCNPQPFKPSLLVIHSCMDPLHLLTKSVQIWGTSSPCSVASVLHASLNFCALAGLNLQTRPIQISLNLPQNLWLCSHENAHNSRATWVCKCSIFSPLWQPVPWSLLQINYYIFCWLFFGFVSLWALQWTWSQLERFIQPSMKWPLVG